MVVTPGQRHESKQLAPVLDAIRVAHPEGRPHRGPEHLMPTGATATRAAGCSCGDVASRTQSPSGATNARDARGGWDAAGLRQGNLPAAQCGGEVRQLAQAVARGGDAIQEAGGQLPGDGRDRRADDLVGLVNHQTRPSRLCWARSARSLRSISLLDGS